MRYMGSKRRLVKDIKPIIEEYRKPGQLYVEPFVGGVNMFCEIPGPKVGYDNNKYLIALLQAASAGWVPRDDYTERQYKAVKKHKDIFPILTGYFAFSLSFGGKFFGGWSRNKGNRDYIAEAYREATKQYKKLIGSRFIQKSYLDIKLYTSAIIYCDPPYAGTTKYKGTFDNSAFWVWAQDMASAGHTVLVSEYSCPVPHELLFEKGILNTLAANNNKAKATEKLFRILPGGKHE